jgi:hypothetical protein
VHNAGLAACGCMGMVYECLGSWGLACMLRGALLLSNMSWRSTSRHTTSQRHLPLQTQQRV